MRRRAVEASWRWLQGTPPNRGVRRAAAKFRDACGEQVGWQTVAHAYVPRTGPFPPVC